MTVNDKSKSTIATVFTEKKKDNSLSGNASSNVSESPIYNKNSSLFLKNTLNNTT